MLYLISQIRGNQKIIWEFVCQGVFNPSLLKDEIDIYYAETARGAHGFLYCLIYVDRKRANHIENAFAAYDRMASESMQIKLTNLPCEPAMIGFGRGNDYKKHVIYKEIQRLKQKGCPSYTKWSASTSETQEAEIVEEVDSGNESPSTQPKKRRADPISTPHVQTKKHQVEPGLNQQTLDSYFKKTDEKLDRIDSGNYESTKLLSGQLSTIDSKATNNFATLHAKLDKIDDDIYEQSKSVSISLNEINDNVGQSRDMLDTKLDVINDNVTDNYDIISDLIKNNDHLEKKYHHVRNKLAAYSARDNRPIHAELANNRARMATMTQQLADMVQLRANIASIEAAQANLAADQTEIKVDIAGLKADIARIEAGLTEIRAAQAKNEHNKCIEEKLDMLLSKD